MCEMDEVAKCMWFLADTGWTVRDDGPTTMIGYSGNMLTSPKTMASNLMST